MTTTGAAADATSASVSADPSAPAAAALCASWADAEQILAVTRVGDSDTQTSDGQSSVRVTGDPAELHLVAAPFLEQVYAAARDASGVSGASFDEVIGAYRTGTEELRELGFSAQTVHAIAAGETMGDSNGDDAALVDPVTGATIDSDALSAAAVRFSAVLEAVEPRARSDVETVLVGLGDGCDAIAFDLCLTLDADTVERLLGVAATGEPGDNAFGGSHCRWQIGEGPEVAVSTYDIEFFDDARESMAAYATPVAGLIGEAFIAPGFSWGGGGGSDGRSIHVLADETYLVVALRVGDGAPTDGPLTELAREVLGRIDQP